MRKWNWPGVTAVLLCSLYQNHLFRFKSKEMWQHKRRKKRLIQAWTLTLLTSSSSVLLLCSLSWVSVQAIGHTTWSVGAHPVLAGHLHCHAQVLRLAPRLGQAAWAVLAESPDEEQVHVIVIVGWRCPLETVFCLCTYTICLSNVSDETCLRLGQNLNQMWCGCMHLLVHQE